MLRHLLDEPDAPSASIGTIGVLIGSAGTHLEGGAGLTTPGPIELQRVLRSLADRSVRTLAMEVSSHSLEQRRVEGMHFDVAVFTNLTRDHLDYHGTMELYFDAKARLISHLSPHGVAVVNADDVAWTALPPAPRRLKFGSRGQGAEVWAEDVRFNPRGSAWTLVVEPSPVTIRVGVAGEAERAAVKLTVNGVEREIEGVWGGESLLYALRERLGLPGSKNACEQGECGSCSVLLDGDLVCSCCVMAADAVDADVRTVEGVGEPEALSDVQQAFLDEGAVQCGFCIPGLIVAVHDLLERQPAADPLEVREAISGNLCRCTGYGRILEAVADRLPRETREYVPKLIAAARIGKDPEAYGFRPMQPAASTWDEATFAPATTLAEIATLYETTVAEIRALNPHLMINRTPNNRSYAVRLPVGSLDRFARATGGEAEQLAE
jgi:aerobic carbon-monoxide dehydrogenase small subunit